MSKREGCPSALKTCARASYRAKVFASITNDYSSHLAKPPIVQAPQAAPQTQQLYVRRQRGFRTDPPAEPVRHSDRYPLGTVTCSPEKRNTPELSSPRRGNRISTPFFPFFLPSASTRVQSRSTAKVTLAPRIHRASGLSTTTTSGGRTKLYTRSKWPSTAVPFGASSLPLTSRITATSLAEKGSPAAAVSV